MQLPELAIRQINVNDAALLRTVAVRAYCDHYLQLWHDAGEWYLQTYFTEAHLREELGHPNAAFFLIYYTEQPVGFLKLNIDKPTPDGNANALELERIYLTKEASGKGIGAAVMDFIGSIAIERKKEVVWLKVMDTSSGPIRFYEKMGFEICGTYRLPFSQMKESVRGMYIMQKNL